MNRNDFQPEYREYTTLPPDHVLEGLIDLALAIFPGKSRGDMLARLPNLPSPHYAVALLSGKVVGFKIGYRLNERQFYSWLGGVSTEYRGHGIATALMECQHAYCRSAAYRFIRTISKNKWKSMIILNLRMGFDIVGAYTDTGNEPKIIMRKALNL